MDNEKNSENAPVNWASLVPELFYDLIGRVIPGIAFIIGLVYVLDKTIIHELWEQKLSSGQNFDPPYTFIFILLLGAGYATGLILTFIGDWLCSIFKTYQFKRFLNKFALYDYIKNLAMLPSKLTNKSENELSRSDCEALFQLQHNDVKKNNAREARSLSKSGAEVQLCVNTSAAYIILSIVLILRCIFCKEFSQNLDLIIFAAIAIVTFLAASYRNERFLFRQFSFSAEIKKEKEEEKNSKNQNGEKKGKEKRGREQV